MDDGASPASQQANPALPGSEQVNNVPEVKEDMPKAEKWPFSEAQPIREDQVRNAVNFLSHPKVRGTPMVQRFSFLERKGLTREEIDEAFRRCPDPPTSEATKTVVPLEGKLVTGPQTQTHSPSMHQAMVSASQPAQHYISGPSSAIVPARPGYHWSQLILGTGLIAAAGAGTGYFFQKVLAPKFRVWLRDMVLDEKKKATEAKIGVQGKSSKLSPLEEAVGAAATAANAAVAVAAEVANTSREILKLQAEELQQLRSLVKSLDTKTEELRSTVTIMSKNTDLKGQMVSAHAEEPIGANYYKGSVKTYQRTATPVEHVQMNQDIQMSKPMAMGNGVDRSQSNGMTNNHVSHSEEEPWWHRKKVEVETVMSPKHVDSVVSELESGLDQEIGSDGSRINEFAVQSRGGRQGWMPPPAPQTVMPGAASAIWYHRPAMVHEVKPSIMSEEKAVDSQTSFEQRPQSLLQTRIPGSPSAIRIEEAGPSVVAEEKEMDAKTLFEQSNKSAVSEVTEITSVDKEIPFSSVHEWVEGGGLAPLKVPEIHADG